MYRGIVVLSTTCQSADDFHRARNPITEIPQYTIMLNTHMADGTEKKSEQNNSVRTEENGKTIIIHISVFRRECLVFCSSYYCFRAHDCTIVIT